ncbi:hypothetical protein D1007_21617 [Hordeum vulgare]|uniref:Predicted protein n=1 Tax=Hordeum vulgare subsp. vulgare TaxID=112509 RepID=F2CUW9_HORVV|nr:uncharacterized protein LOC123442892 [Hordeum vulgare subsp. vulgare]KAE8802586.1 hypothetical protein D1007_21617 [Hordeum vulgare]BAJ86640.1 predicted protein [Hordeum vulgare subsp. vulgare]BAJ93527.1 predicted protein [Hordeum vulgare subsp. vulgare]BAJ95396.1 predicted protein [Hordeum vulgare subsp. vulgare]
MVVRRSPARRRGVRVGPTKLEGLPAAWSAPAVAAVKVKWPGAGGALSQMLTGRRGGRGVTAVEPVGGDGAVRWDAAADANRFRVDVDPGASPRGAGAGPGAGGPCRPDRGVFFSILYGFQEQGRGKDLVRLDEIGTAMISLEECCWEMQLQQQRQKVGAAPLQQLVVVPIRVKKDGWASDAMLYVNVELVDLSTPSEAERSVSFREKPRANPPAVPTMREIHRGSSTYHEVLDLKQLLDLADKQGRVAVYRNKRNSDTSSVSSGGMSSSSSTVSLSSASTSTSGGASPEPGSTSKRRFLPWRRRSRESLSQEMPVVNDDAWETREFTSRDSETRLRTPVFFASIDQRDDSAGGESACTALVAVLAAALHANHPLMPTRAELDALIRDGSSEWRRLCDDEAHMAQFPNRHFDLETVLAARTRPIAVEHDRAFVGFFQPESFASLSGAMSFDDIWREISAADRAPGHADVYIVSWNDHFFVLKAESDCYYVVDTLGERLHEGCDRAYMLRFDATSEMRAVPSPESSPSSEEAVVATGKECCGEFIKRFLAAIPLREELHIEQSGCADAGAPHRRLQIEFHFTVLQQMISGVCLLRD